MDEFVPIPSETETVGRQVLDAAFSVHRELGPGLMECVYEACLLHELRLRGLHPQQQISRPLVYKGVRLESGLRLDLVINDLVIVELKAVDTMLPVYRAQLLSYLRLSELRLGFLINFNVPLLRDGIERIVR